MKSTLASRAFQLVLAGVMLAPLASYQSSLAQDRVAELWQVRGIQRALSDPESDIQYLALNEINSFTRIDGISPMQIVPLLAADDPLVVGAAARALGRIQAKQEIPRLVQLLESPDMGVRWSTAYPEAG